MKIAFVGDWHANLEWSVSVAGALREEGCDAIVSVGDFGYWPRRSSKSAFIPYLSKYLQSTPLYFVDGNHEDHTSLDALPIQDDGFRAITQNIFHVPRGHSWNWDGVQFLGLGGAVSLNKARLKREYTWFAREKITPVEAMRAIAAGLRHPVDVMLTHETVKFRDDYQVPNIASRESLPQDALLESDAQQELLTNVVSTIRPRRLVHGHHHRRYDAAVRLSNGHDLHVIGLGADRTSVLENALITTTEELKLV